MAIQQIPVRSDIPAYTFQITLDTDTFTFKYRFNTRLNRWVWDIFDQAGDTIILAGVPLLTNLQLLRQYVSVGLPKGRFAVIDETGENQNPGRESLGEDFKKLYEEATI